MFKSVRAYLQFIGHKVTLLLCLEVVIGALWFLVEALFLVVLQGFLISIGFQSTIGANLTSWYPTSISSSLILLFAYGVGRSMLLALKKYLPNKASIEFSSEQRRKVLRISLKTKHNKSTPEIISFFTDLINKSGHFISFFSQSVSLAVSSVLGFLLCIKLAPVESIIGIGFSALLFFPFRYLNKMSKSFGKKQNIAIEETNRILVEGIKNLFLLRIYNLVDHEIDKGNEQIKAYEKTNEHYNFVLSIINSAPFLFGIFIICIVTYVSKTFLLTDSTLYVAFLYMFLRLNQTLSGLLTALSTTSFYRDSFQKLYNWSCEYSQVKDTSITPESIVPGNNEIVMKALSFSYNQDQTIFDNLNLTIPSGEFFLIKGPSGAGKSTFLKLLFGLESPNRGEVLVNGLTPFFYMNNFSENIGYVGPEPFLIPASVRSNLLYGNSNKAFPDEIIWESLDKFGLKKLISEMPAGLDEKLHEDSQLSTGQKQRLSFVRAILRSPKILILDEATANIDHVTEKLILKYLEELKGKTTILVVSHRDSFDFLYDRLIEIKGDSICNLVENVS